VVDATIAALESKQMIGKANANSNSGNSNGGKPEKSAYAKTESLLYNYRGFQKIVAERMQEIEEIRKYGVPKKSKSITQYGGDCGGVPGGLVLDEESVEAAVHTVEASVEGTVQALALIDKCMESLKKDPYYCILEMRYFEGRTQEDIAIELKCTQKTISIQKSRLVKELAMRLFPNDVINEYMS
jgi:hypothetical protein